MIQQQIESVEHLEKDKELSQGLDLIEFQDNQQDIEEFKSDYSSPVYKDEGSAISDETEKRKKEVRDKIKQYLSQRRQQGMAKGQKKMIYDDEEELDGALINQLGSIEGVQRFNSEIQRFILMFNKNPDQAINAYIEKKLIPTDSPQEIAKYLIKIQGLDKGLLGDYFGKNNSKTLKVLHSFCGLLKFQKVQFDKAIRHLLGRFRLPGEAQQIERIIWQFALAFYQANQGDYDNADELFPLAYAIIMLATDAHNPKQEVKMTKEDFIKNTQRPCPSIRADYLNGIYDRIVKERFQTESSYMETLYARLKDLSSSDITGSLNLTKDLMKGDVFLKVCKNTNKFVQRKMNLTEDQDRIQWINDPPKGFDEEPRFIFIRDIIDLTLGLGSPVMKKNKVPEQFDSLCFTIETIHRSLDLKAKTNKERAKWVNYIKAILIRRRQSRKQELELYYQANMSKERIQEVWNTEIFPHWDKHWDYKKKKPKEKNIIVRGMEALCCCLSNKPSAVEGFEAEGTTQGLRIKSSLLDTLWKLGLPHNSRKTLWPLVIGNSLALTATMIEQVKKRVKKLEELRKFYTFAPQIIELAEIVRQFRLDLPPVRDLLLVSEVFCKAIPNNSLVSFVNLIHMHHFMSFYRGEKLEIESRIKLFEFILQKNAPKVRDHFIGLKLETRMYLVSWFLSIFADCFNQQFDFLLRLWDNFLLQGEIYLFKVGIAIVKYYEIELKMCTFHEGLKLLRFPKNTSQVLFFEILNEEIDVKEEYYHEYVEKRKHAIIKTKVQAIPLE